MSPFLELPKRSEVEAREAQAANTLFRAIVPEQNWRERFEDGEIVETALTPDEQAMLDHITRGGSPRTFKPCPPKETGGDVTSLIDVVLSKPGALL